MFNLDPCFSYCKHESIKWKYRPWFLWCLLEIMYILKYIARLFSQIKRNTISEFIILHGSHINLYIRRNVDMRCIFKLRTLYPTGLNAALDCPLCFFLLVTLFRSKCIIFSLFYLKCGSGNADPWTTLSYFLVMIKYWNVILWHYIVCKRCIVKWLQENNTCPTCEMVIHQSHPLQYIRYIFIYKLEVAQRGRSSIDGMFS